MTGIATTAPSRSGGHGWQLILADLALILFLLTLSALPAAEAEGSQKLADSDARQKDAKGAITAQVDASQALYRVFPGGPTLRAWLAAQQPDARATLTIFAVHGPGRQADAWTQASALAAEARGSGVAVRTIISAGLQDDVYASLGYDAKVEAAPQGTAG